MPQQPDPRDPVLSDPVVLNLARRHLPAVRAVTGVDESGGEARTYAIDDDIILKTQRPHRVRPRTSLEKEVFHLRTLAEQVPHISVPRVFGYGRDGDIEYTVMSRMPGRALRHVSMNPDERGDLLRELGAMLRVIHSLDVQLFRASGLFPGDEDASDVRARLEADLSRAERSAAQLRNEWTLDVTPEDAAEHIRSDLRVSETQIVPLHSNPGPEHVFLDPETMRITGLIDFGDAYLSHPALDLRRWAQPADRAALLQGYAGEQPLPESFAHVWRAISIIALMLDFAERPGRRTESLDGLRSLIQTSRR